MIRRLRYALTIVRDISMILCPASDYVHSRVDAARDADVLAEREASVDVMEPLRFGPIPGCVERDPRCPSPCTSCARIADSPGTEPTSELLFAAANQLEQVRCHLHFDHPREEYLSRLVPELRARGISFARQYD